jgi:exodeoxyribonuclease V alpha subunit
MVDVLFVNNLLRALPPIASLLLVGDADQLPSVGPGMVLRSFLESGVVLGSRLKPAIRGLSRNQGRR